MDPTPPYSLRTERLLLREFTPDDLDDVHAYACDDATVRYMDWGPNTLEQTRVFLGEEIDRALAAGEIGRTLHLPGAGGDVPAALPHSSPGWCCPGNTVHCAAAGDSSRAVR